MARVISTDAVINSIRLAEQAGDVATIAAGYWQLYAKETGLYLEDDAEIVGGPLGTGLIPGGRLTGTTATPVTTADVNDAATLYYTPYHSNMIELFDGARWIPKTFAELSIDVSALTASKPYDIWAYLNSGAVALDQTVWTDGTTRATALAYQNGRLVKTGATDRRYLGTIYVDADQRTDDSLAKRCVWNYYNRKARLIYKFDGTDHTYNNVAIRYWNNDSTQIFQYLCGVVEDALDLSLSSRRDSTTSKINNLGMDQDAATAYDPNLPYLYIIPPGYLQLEDCSNRTYWPALGYHYLSVIESTSASLSYYEYYLTGTIWG